MIKSLIIYKQLATWPRIMNGCKLNNYSWCALGYLGLRSRSMWARSLLSGHHDFQIAFFSFDRRLWWNIEVTFTISVCLHKKGVSLDTGSCPSFSWIPLWIFIAKELCGAMGPIKYFGLADIDRTTNPQPKRCLSIPLTDATWIRWVTPALEIELEIAAFADFCCSITFKFWWRNRWHMSMMMSSITWILHLD